MRRRIFLKATSRASLALPLLPLMACATGRNFADHAAWQPLTTAFENDVPRLMSEMSVPGVSIAVVNNAKIVWRTGFGFSDAATKEPVTKDTVFEAASMSKPVFAYVVMKLCEKGVIGLDVPLAKYSPSPFWTSDPQVNLITTRHVLSHSSGFQNMRSGAEPLTIAFAPGSQYLYSGEGYYYLQSVITHLLGKTDVNDFGRFEADMEVYATDIDEFMRRRILIPFRMPSSGYDPAPDITPRFATGHNAAGQPFPKTKPSRPALARYAALGALHTTPSDFARFMIEVLNPKPPDEFRLTKPMNAEMLRPHVKVIDGPYTSSWALGWQVQDNGLINHGGDNRGFHCHAIASPKTKSGFVVMTNGDNGPQLIQRLFALTEFQPFFSPKPTANASTG